MFVRNIAEFWTFYVISAYKGEEKSAAEGKKNMTHQFSKTTKIYF